MSVPLQDLYLVLERPQDIELIVEVVEDNKSRMDLHEVPNHLQSRGVAVHYPTHDTEHLSYVFEWSLMTDVPPISIYPFHFFFVVSHVNEVHKALGLCEI